MVAIAIALFVLLGGLRRRPGPRTTGSFETTSPGIGVPQWIYTIWLPLLSAVIALRIAGRVARLLRRRGLSVAG